LFLVTRSIWWYVGHDRMGVILSPWYRKCSNIPKTVEIPTPKPYIFLFLVSSSIWWYASHDRTLWSHSPLNRKCPYNYIWKTIEILTSKSYIHVLLFLVSSNIWWCAGHDHTEWSCPPCYRKCPNISKTVEIPTPKPYKLLFLVSSSI
jgi:hypothetical protein